MPKLRSEELAMMGDMYLSLAQAVGRYRMENRPDLTKTQNQQIRELHLALLGFADDFYNTAAALVLDDIKPSLERLQDITDKVNRTYHRLKSFQKAIDIAGAGISLANAFFTKNLLRINEAINEFEKQTS